MNSSWVNCCEFGAAVRAKYYLGISSEMWDVCHLPLRFYPKKVTNSNRRGP